MDEHLFQMIRDWPGAVVGKGYRSTIPGFADVLEDYENWASLAYIKCR